MKPQILFFTRQAYVNFFPKLASERFESRHVCMSLREKAHIEGQGFAVEACFEQEYEALPLAEVPNGLFRSGYHGERYMAWMRLEERRVFTAKALSFWRQVFGRRPYLAFVHETISMEMEELLHHVGYNEFGARDLNFFISPIPGFFYWKDSPYHSGFELDTLAKPSKGHAPAGRVDEYLAQVKEKGHKPFFLYKSKIVRPRVSAKGYLLAQARERMLRWLRPEPFDREQRLRDSIFLSNTGGAHFDYGKILDENWQKARFDYDDIQRVKPFRRAFFPLHYEPEATLLYFDARYSNQVAVLENIAKSLPLDHVLMVKEHPQQPGFLMLDRFRALRERNPNILFFPAEVESLWLLKISHMVITICGSVGWEALIHNVPIVVLSNVFYDKHPQVVKPRDFTHLREILLRPEGLPHPTDEATRDYLARLHGQCYPGNPADSRLYDNPENLARIRFGLEAEIALTLSQK